LDAPKPAGGHEVVEGATDEPPQKPSEQTPVDGAKLNEILKLLRSQLKSQQQQLDLLQGLTKSAAAEEISVPKPTPSLADYERAVKWMNKGIPDSVHLEKLGEDLIKECAQRGQLWFPEPAAQTHGFHILGGEASDVTRCHVFGEPSLEQRLLWAWPESLGKPELDTRFVWDSQIGIHDWHIYNGVGEVPAQVKWPRMR
jgi:hypothetical protein